MKQGELFAHPNASKLDQLGDKSRAPSPQEKWEVRLTLDKAIFGSLASLILLIVIFTWGVEHGRSLQKEKMATEREVESITNLARVTAAEKSLNLQTDSGPIEEGVIEDKKSWSLFSIFSRKTRRATKATNDRKVSTDEAIEIKAPSRESENALQISEFESQKLEEDITRETEPQIDLKPRDPKPEIASEKRPLPTINLEKAYEVRIMSLGNEEYAEKEVKKLQGKGLRASFRKSGDYYLVILGPYPIREEADRFLEQARKLNPFKDAYIRRLA